MELTKNDLLVLGLLLDRPMHGYEISQQIKSESIHTWFDISMSAIYYSLNKLNRYGLVSETRMREEGAEKSVYHLTDAGREQFFAGMEATLASEQPIRFDYDLGIYMLNKLPRERALVLLEKRLDFIRQHVLALKQLIAQERCCGDRPLHLAILEHAVACTQMEIDWLESIVRRVRGEDEEEAGQSRPLTILSGDLRDFHLPDLIKLIVAGQHSGTLTVSDGTVVRTISFDAGRPVCATSSTSPGGMDNVQQTMNDIYDLFRWQEGAFTFDQSLGPQKGCLVLRLSAQELILAGTRWVDNWTAVQRVVPSPDMVFERREGGPSAADLSLTAEECQVLDLLDGLNDVTTIARQCGLTEFETSKILYSLHAVGLIQPGDMDKIRLRRVFREFAELTCRGTLPHRAHPQDFSCELEVNQRCAELPVRFVAGRIEDRTDPTMRTEHLAQVYRTFLQTQRAVIRERFGDHVAEGLWRQVWAQISPGLRETLKRYNLVADKFPVA